MRINASLWGGSFNPIIPVFRTTPKAWRSDLRSFAKGYEVAKGYIEFFQPDVYVEARKGLSELVGLGKLRGRHEFHKIIVTLDEFLIKEIGKTWSEPAFGVSMNDFYPDIYEREFKFSRSEKIPVLKVKDYKDSLLTEVLFGAFPSVRHYGYCERQFVAAFKPEVVEPTPKTWLKYYSRAGALTPLLMTRDGLSWNTYWYHDPVVFIFDPSNPLDVIDLWNMRLEPCPVIPVPKDWVSDLSKFIGEIIRSEHKPVQGNPNGIMHQCTIEFSRTCTEQDQKKALEEIGTDFPAGARCIKTWRNPIWTPQSRGRGPNVEIRRIKADEKSVSISINAGDEIRGTFETLSPKFASPYTGKDWRWVNTLSLSSFGPEKISTVFPHNTFDRSWPPLAITNGNVSIGREGWVFGQSFKGHGQYVNFLSQEAGVIGFLEQAGIKARLSDAGHVAKHVLEHLKGLWGVRLLANGDVIRLLNKMSMSVRRRGNDGGKLEEEFEGRSCTPELWSRTLKVWKPGFREISIKEYTDRNVLRLGLETKCPSCQGKNWHGLDTLDYQVSCNRCLNEYSFPQSEVDDRRWRYRVIGPFSVPDYARGSYAVLLTLRAIDTLTSSRAQMTFATGLDLNFDGNDREADFVVLRRDDTFQDESNAEVIIGECKSFSEGDVVKPKDIVRLKELASKLPGSIIMISVLKDGFSSKEKALLYKLSKWGRRPNHLGRASHPVVLLTGIEQFIDFRVTERWEKLGGRYAECKDYEAARNLYNLAFSTQYIHLGLSRYYSSGRRRGKSKTV